MLINIYDRMEIIMNVYDWQKPAKKLDDYFFCEMKRGREFLIRLTTGADPVLAIQKFAKEQHVHFGKIHATFMGAFKPCKYLIWTPDTTDISNWHNESVATNNNLSMLCSIGGMISMRPTYSGGKEPFVAMHFVAGGAWDTHTFGGHLVEGTKIAGCMQVFITELTGIEVLDPVDEYNEAYTYPENFYKSLFK